MNSLATFVSESEFEKLARRVWYAHWKIAGKKDAHGQKRASFSAMGYKFGANFPMRQDEWVNAGKYDIRVTYAKWDIPSYIWVRKAQA